MFSGVICGGSTPSRNPLTFMWLCHTFVSLKVNVFLLFAHISSYFILITFLSRSILFYFYIGSNSLSITVTSVGSLSMFATKVRFKEKYSQSIGVSRMGY